MTKTELYDYIKSLGKEPGTYTEEELVDIGIKHQALISGKDWPELADFLKVGKSGEQFRKWILHKRYKMGVVPKNPRVLDDKTVEEATLEDKAEVLRREKEEIYKAKTQFRDERNAINRMLRDDSRIERLEQTMIECAKSQTELPAIAYDSMLEWSTNSEAVLMLSDWHIGQESDNFYNKYNFEIARQRVSKIVSQTIDYCRLHSVKVLHVLNLGDLIEGIINTNARVEQEFDVADQLIKASELMAEALNLLQMAAPVVTYRDVTDNHSRFNADKHVAIAKENFNRLTTWFVKARLEGSNIKFIDDNLDIGFGRFEMSNGFKIAFMHGHEDKKTSIFQNVVGAVREWTDIVCIGHWHNPAEHVFQDMRVYVNGSLCGTGPYALSNRYFTKPSQKLIIVDNNNLLNMDLAAE